MKNNLLSRFFSKSGENVQLYNAVMTWYNLTMNSLYEPAADRREQVTDWYLIIILFLFPLFPGFSGYSDITVAKYAFYLAATGLWLAALIALSVRERRGVGRLGAAQIAAVSFLGICLLSWLLSPWRRDSFLGMGRFDGLLTLACYLLTFLGVSAFTRAKRVHAAAFAAGMFLCCALGALQIFGLDLLRLFPDGVTYYDAGTLYSGVYLGTIGNTNILDAALCLSLPLCAGLYICGESPLFLLAALPCCFCLFRAGGSGAALAFAVCALWALPLLVTDTDRLRRMFRAAGVILLTAAAAGLYRPDYVNQILTPRFSPSFSVLLTLVGATAFLLISFLPARGFAPSKRALRIGFLILDAAVILAGLAALWFWPGGDGAGYELSRALHGQLEPDFGSSRVLIWRECLALFSERPLLGGGPGTLALRLDVRFSRFVPETGETLSSFVDNAHSIYLGYLINCGALGLAAYLGLLGCSFRTAIRSRTCPMTASLALAALCAAVHGLFGLGLCLSEPLFWAVLGLQCARNKEEITWEN